ncbi:hypothetical protein DL93DRAFT_2125506 [Clavulina sp. PMI_390]|nr:hypothetical protein DL93DRAFT_2125506 [Clavulina sp. PMI_390]
MTMKEALLEPLLQFTSLSENLFRSLAPTNFSSKPPPPPPFSELARCDVQLASALHEARIHQGKQKEINRLAEDILSLEGQLREAIMAFADGKAALEERIEEGDDVLHRAAVSSSDSLSYQEILTYASNLATFTSAPPTVDPLRPEAAFDGTIIPPFPTVEMMRRGKMNMEPPLGSLGEMREVGVGSNPDDMFDLDLNPDF